MQEIKRHYFFEFSGMPKSGKTTTVESIRHLYKRLGYNVQSFSGHDRTVGVDKSNPRELNIILASKSVEFLVKNSVNECKPTIFLMDRGIFDRSVFIRLAYNQRALSLEEKEVITRFLLLPNNCKMIDGLFVFTVNSEESMKREYSKTLVELPGRVMNVCYLNEFSTALNDTFNENNRFEGKKYWIDTTEQTPRETGLFVAKQIWKIIGGNTDEFPVF